MGRALSVSFKDFPFGKNKGRAEDALRIMGKVYKAMEMEMDVERPFFG